jgi:hypothetical protein
VDDEQAAAFALLGDGIDDLDTLLLGVPDEWSDLRLAFYTDNDAMDDGLDPVEGLDEPAWVWETAASRGWGAKAHWILMRALSPVST